MRAMPSADRDVLSSLPSRRPTRRSAKRGGPVPQATGEAAAQPAPPAPTTARKATPKAAKATAAKPKAKAAPKSRTAPPSQRPASPPPPPAGWAAPRPEREDPGRGELLGTAVQAVGELTQIGLGYGVRTLRQALSRLPKP
jgi:hypothetical protein